MKAIFSTVIFNIFLLSNIAAQNDTLLGRVIALEDGDSFTMLTSKKTQYKIRLKHIDCPEKGQAFGKKAKQSLSDYIYPLDVLVVYSDTDRYGRIIGDVYQRYRYINLLMVQKGMAWHFVKYSKDVRFEDAQLKAEQLRLGLWKDPHPMSPWDWRKMKRKKE